MLLADDEPVPVEVERVDAASPYVLVCDHGGQHIPRSLQGLGLPAHERDRHIAWDIGAHGVARTLSAKLNAPLVWQNYSRLVIDCNRPLSSPDLIAERSEATDIPGNVGLDGAAREARVKQVYEPYHERIKELLNARLAAGLETVFISVHSFTPVYHGHSRPWDLGVLYGHDTRLSSELFACLVEERDLTVGDNAPYRIDSEDHCLPEHALRRNLPNVLLEIRQDLIVRRHEQTAWGERLAGLLVRATVKL